MKGELGDKVRLQHILDAIELIQNALNDKSQEDFESNLILQAAVERWMTIIGEATYKLTMGFKRRISQVEWKSIEGLRHIIVHEYFGVDLERIWTVTQIDLPKLKINIEEMVKRI